MLSLMLSIGLVVLGLRLLHDPVVSTEFGGSLGGAIMVIGAVLVVRAFRKHGFRAIFLTPPPRLWKMIGVAVLLFVLFSAIMIISGALGRR
jgi:hypothetical protein